MKAAYGLNHSSNKHEKPPYLNKRKAPSLQKILEKVKYLQSCVSQIDASHKEDCTVLAKRKQNKSDRRVRSASVEPSKRQRISQSTIKPCDFQHQCQSIQTIRKSSKRNHIQSDQLKNQSQTFELTSFDSMKKSQIKGIGNEDYFPMSFVSLQIQNLKLEKHNLNLEKQLLQKELFIQRREKKLLKDKIKRIKTHNLGERLSQHSKKEQIDCNSNSNGKQFKYSPIKIKIPQFFINQELFQVAQNKAKRQKSLSKPNLYGNSSRNNSQHDDIKNKTLKSIISNKKNIEIQDSQQLLISNISRYSSIKQNQGSLQKQFWTLLGQCGQQKPQEKWEMREALGDIANKLKEIRKK